MKNNQKILLIIICSILVIITFLAVVLSSNIKNNDNVNNSNNENIHIEMNKEITRLKDDSEFFTIQNIINNFYILRINQDTDGLLSILNKEYIQNNNITKANVLNFINIKNDNINFQAEEIYYNAESIITYYFIKGYIIDSSFEGVATYNDGICYLLIKDSINNYSIMPLNNIDNLEEYAKNYNIKEINIENNSNFKISEISENSKLMSYISNFSSIIFINSSKAYGMLDDNTKKIYPDFNSFNNQLENIYNKLSTKFLATGSIIKDNIKIYKIKNNDGSTITITEYYPNDYKIGFEFN